MGGKVVKNSKLIDFINIIIYQQLRDTGCQRLPASAVRIGLRARCALAPVAPEHTHANMIMQYDDY